jgi:uncharacterized GH25 family protein
MSKNPTHPPRRDSRREGVRRILLLAAIAAAPAALAHDFWIEPSTFRPAVGVRMSAALRVGQDFTGDPVGRDSEAIDKFIVRDNAGERDIPGLEHRDPAGLFTVDKAGGAVVGYRTHPKYLEMPPDKFEQYLRDEGLEKIVEARAKRGESQKPSREIYSRCAKSLLVAGDGPSNFEKPLAFRYEIVPLKIAADAIDVRLLYESKPLAGALVIALNRDDPTLRIRLRSDAAGRVSFKLPKRGVWLIKSVWMIPAPPSSNADWESLWASLTFEQ